MDVVKGCRKPIGKTDLYHKIKTKHNDFERWLNTAIRFKLVELTGNKYHATAKGLQWLESWKNQEAFLTEE